MTAPTNFLSLPDAVRRRILRFSAVGAPTIRLEAEPHGNGNWRFSLLQYHEDDDDDDDNARLTTFVSLLLTSRKTSREAKATFFSETDFVVTLRRSAPDLGPGVERVERPFSIINGLREVEICLTPGQQNRSRGVATMGLRVHHPKKAKDRKKTYISHTRMTIKPKWEKIDERLEEDDVWEEIERAQGMVEREVQRQAGGMWWGRKALTKAMEVGFAAVEDFWLLEGTDVEEKAEFVEDRMGEMMEIDDDDDDDDDDDEEMMGMDEQSMEIDDEEDDAEDEDEEMELAENPLDW